MSRYDDAARSPTAGPILPDRKTLVRARGYSLLELERAGLTEADAERLGIPVDPGRRSMIGANAMQLRRIASG